MPAVGIDGPIGSGKTSVAFHLAALLGWQCVPTGSMYRALAFLTRDVPAQDRAAHARRIAACAVFQPVRRDDGTHLVVDGADLTQELDNPLILPVTSVLAQDREVRAALTARQRELAGATPSIVEGRDANTEIVPEAAFRFYLDADPAVRYERLHRIHRSQAASPLGVAEFDRLMREVDARDSARLRRSRLVDGVIYHKNFAELRADQDAVVLYYYLKRGAEMAANLPGPRS
jgi:cytidylate kinase